MADIILLTSSVANSYDFLFDNLWEKAYYWRYITITTIFLMIIYKRKFAYYDKLNKQLENDKIIIRKALFTFSEMDLKELMKNLISNNCYSATQFNNLKELKKHLNESESKLLSENLQKAAGELKSSLITSIDFLEKYFTNMEDKSFFKLKTTFNMDTVDEFEIQDKIFSVLTAFESQYFSFCHAIKKEFI